MKPIIVTATRDIQIQKFNASDDQAQVVELAIASFGHLIKSQPPAAYSFPDFAALIEKHYNVTENARNRAMVSTLKEVQALNEQHNSAARNKPR